MKIVYLGPKSSKSDNVAQTGLTWTPGQVHDVTDEKKANILVEHKCVWADADKPYEIVPELKLVKNEEPMVIVKSEDDPVDNYVIELPATIIRKLNSGELLPVFMTNQDADEFETWKLDRDTAPKQTAPVPEKKKGLEKKSA